jgi:hypothetical protein
LLLLLLLSLIETAANPRSERLQEKDSIRIDGHLRS